MAHRWMPSSYSSSSAGGYSSATDYGSDEEYDESITAKINSIRTSTAILRHCADRNRAISRVALRTGKYGTYPRTSGEIKYSPFEKVPDGTQHFLLKLLPIPTDFVSPLDVKLNTVGSTIVPQEVHICVAPTIYHPSEIYLAFANDWPHKFDKFAEEMTEMYQKLKETPKRFEWLVDDRYLQPGAIVAVRRTNPDEWVRARITRLLSREPETLYKVHLIDFGEYYQTGLTDIAYLHQSFANQPQGIIRCRVKLSQQYDKYHTKQQKWDEHTRLALFKTLNEKQFQVRFLREIHHRRQQRIWEVSLEGFVEPQELIEHNRNIQEQVIERAKKICARD